MPKPVFRKIFRDSFYYSPLSVSIGPYEHIKNHSKKQSLTEHRDKCLLRIRARQAGEPSEKTYKDALTPLLNELIKMYPDLNGNEDGLYRSDQHLANHDTFLEMIMTDAWYLLLILDKYGRQPVSVLKYNDEDRRLLNNANIDKYKRDMLLYENQIPLEVLAVIAAVQNPQWSKLLPAVINDWDIWREWMIPDISRFLVDLVVDFYSLPKDAPADPEHQHLHILHIYQYMLVGTKQEIIRHNLPYPITQHPTSDRDDKKWYQAKPFNIPSAKDLEDARIEIRISEKPFLFEIEYDSKTLILPRVCPLDQISESGFYNVIEFERLDPSMVNYFSSCIYFFSKLIKSRQDSILLMNLGIINTSWNDEKMVEMFERYRNRIGSDHGKEIQHKLLEVGRKLRNRYTKNMQPWRMDLFGKYLRTPCAQISLVVGFLILAFTGFQTVYTILGYYK